MDEKPSVGRPSKFNDVLKEKIIKLAENGKTNEQIADIIGVHVRTIENWQGKYPQLMWAVKEAKQIADDLVEASLFSKAVGYSHKETKVFFDSKSLQTVEHEVIQQYPPDTVAAIFWLKNRQPDRWREKQPGEDDKKITHEGAITINSTDLLDRVNQIKGD